MMCCVRCLCVCVYKIKTWYIFKMQLLFSCLKKQQNQSQLKGKISWISVCIWSFRKPFLTPQHTSLLAVCLPGTAWEAPRALQRWHRLSCPRWWEFWLVDLFSVKRSGQCLIGNCRFCSLCQVLKSWFCCCDCCRCRRSIHCICLFQSLFWKHSKWVLHWYGQKINNKIGSWGFIFHVQVTKLSHCRGYGKEYCG